jgi:transcriptional regulator with XRE-family HTH domain
MPKYEFSGEQLREIREAADRERDELGDEVDRSESAITLYELGYRKPPVEVLIELANVLGVEVEDFFVQVDREPVVAQ